MGEAKMVIGCVDAMEAISRNHKITIQIFI